MDHVGYAAFRDAVAGCSLTYSKQILRYRGLGGDEFTFYADQSQSPKVNGKTVDYAPAMVFDSPFVRSKWCSGVVGITKGERTLVLDFNE